MGKQIQIATNLEDETNFLNFLKVDNKISIIISNTIRKEDLIINDIKDISNLDFSYFIWNRVYDWKPEYGQVVETSPFKDMIGKYYIKNTNNAPLIEFTRSKLEERKFGRIYWAKYFATPDGLKYNIKLFDDWYKKVSNYFIENCVYIKKYANLNTYIMEKAYKFLKNKKLI